MTVDIGGSMRYNGAKNADNLSGLNNVANRINGLGGNDVIAGGDLADMLDG